MSHCVAVLGKEEDFRIFVRGYTTFYYGPVGSNCTIEANLSVATVRLVNFDQYPSPSSQRFRHEGISD